MAKLRYRRPTGSQVASHQTGQKGGTSTGKEETLFFFFFLTSEVFSVDKGAETKTTDSCLMVPRGVQTFYYFQSENFF